MLCDRKWQIKYTPDDGDLVELFYIPALEDAERYDRLTGYFDAHALTLAARGIEGLVRNSGRMRLLVGCTLGPPEIEAIERGEELREQVEKRLSEIELAPPDASAAGALELLAWMVGRGHLDVKVAVPCDAGGRPINDSAIFHEKSGIVEDRAGNRIAWAGSLNETAAGWQRNWESISVFTSWGPEPERVNREDGNFDRLWANRSPRVSVLDVPEAVRRDLMRFMPDGMPSRLKKSETGRSGRAGGASTKADTAPGPPATLPAFDRRSLVWNFIKEAPSLIQGGARVGETTAAVTPWPHQVRAFDRMYERWPPKLLIADEVGLGKTIQAGMLLRQAWLAGQAKRILILAPKAVLRQWQIELREKFNLNWPIYDGQKLIRYPSPGLRGEHERAVDGTDWLKEPVVIASSHLMRRHERAMVLLNNADTWDLVVLDEAHHARRRGAGATKKRGPNALLKLMQGLKEHTQGLILLTATPMQVHPVEVWDLLNLLGLPTEWKEEAFLNFFDDVEHPNPPAEAMERMAELFRAAEHNYGKVTSQTAERLAGLSRLKTNRTLRALRDQSSIPRRQLETQERQGALAIMRGHTPISHLISRHTRELLRRYVKAGALSNPIANRQVEDRFIDMTTMERELYAAVEHYIATTYNQAEAAERTAVGFVMTIYRRRLASSFQALCSTLEKRLNAIKSRDPERLIGLEEDAPDDETADDIPDAEEIADLGRRALDAEEQADIKSLLDRIRLCPPDTKLQTLSKELAALREKGYEQAMVFTQYVDTMEFLREELNRSGDVRLMCFSGRGGEIPSADGVWRRISRDDAKRRFRDGKADILLCTDAAAEGLNFQFCGALVNYDMPWNPMRVEQRIGRIDRLGQRHPVICVVNLHYEGTVETDVYRVLRSRISLFETVVGRLQPILARLPQTLSDAALSGSQRANVIDLLKREVKQAESGGFDIDTVLEKDLIIPDRPASPVTMDDLDRIIASSNLMPPGTDIQPMGHREYGLLAPGMDERVRVTTDPAYYEEHAESVELWSPGNPLFNAPELLSRADENPSHKTLKDILDEAG